jgi:hypothetical protein
MKRFAIGAVLAAAVAFGTSGIASAQYVTGYTVITPNGSVVTNKQVVTFGGVKQFNSVVSPFGVQKQAFYGDVFGNSFGRASGFNTFNGFGYNTGFYRPGPFVPAFGGYNYGFYGRRW